MTFPDFHRVWTIFCLAVKKFWRIDGTKWAAAFAFNAFFSLFPLMIVIVTLASFFIDWGRAGKEIIAFMESYIPSNDEMQRHLFKAIAGVVKARGQAGAIAFIILVWSALQCFATIVCVTNRAWNAAEYNWWRLPLKSLILLGVVVSMVFSGVVLSLLVKMAKHGLFPMDNSSSWVYAVWSFIIPLLLVFLSLSLFYRLSPRRPTRFAEVWAAALCATVLLQTAESLFVIYLRNFATFDAVYGALGGIMALLLWIYVSGCVFIFGACLCAAQTEGRSSPAETTTV